MNTKNQIIKTSLKHFISQGYDYTSLNQIAEDVGIKKSSLYYHFKSKDDLLYEGIKMITQELNVSIADNVQKNKQTRLRLENLFESILDFNSNISLLLGNNFNAPANINAFFQMSSNRFENVSILIDRFYDDIVSIIKDIIITGQDKNEVKKNIDVEMTSIDILSRIEGLITLSSIYKKIDLNKIRLVLYENLWSGLQIEEIKDTRKAYKTIDFSRIW
ncbi:MAG: TetR/AcrR family transcriptional regulator [Bacillota bacterium]|nr:TetR/AcrR family transcriptional regulator [Bacillota bacterium]